MKSIFAALGVLALLACSTQPGSPSALRRKAITPPGQSGWVRVPLDGEAQRTFPRIWVGNAQGRSVPFLVASDSLWTPRPLQLSRVLLGRDSQDQPTADFQLGLPEGWQVRDREHLNLSLELTGEGPWACRVQVERALEGGAWSRLETPAPLYVHDLGSRLTDITIPWDAMRYRLTLVPLHGRSPRLQGIQVTAATQPDAVGEALLVTPELRAVPGQAQTWDVHLPESERVVGADVELLPPVAPLLASWSTLEPPRPEQPRETERSLPCQGLLWNLPALDRRSTRVALSPVVTKHLRLHLPEGATPSSVRLLVRRHVLILSAQAGEGLWLHLGGQVRRAPGHLEALPHSSRMVFASDPLALGPGEPDPEGLPDPLEQPNPLKAWLPWIAALVVVGMGAYGFRLLRRG